MKFCQKINSLTKHKIPWLSHDFFRYLWISWLFQVFLVCGHPCVMIELKQYWLACLLIYLFIKKHSQVKVNTEILDWSRRWEQSYLLEQQKVWKGRQDVHFSKIYLHGFIIKWPSISGLANFFNVECQYFVVLSYKRFGVLRQKIKWQKNKVWWATIYWYNFDRDRETSIHFFLLWGRDQNGNSI